MMQVSAVEVTPIEKVISLLSDLHEKISAEGKKEAAQYDKFACFCKEQADEKLYAIEKSNALLKDLKAERDELKYDAGMLNNEVLDLGDEQRHLQHRIDDKINHRNNQHDRYLERAQDMNEAISACGRAIEALKSSKQEMRGAKIDLTQVTSGLVKVVKRQPLLASAPGATTLLAKLDQHAPKFEYQSNDIIATLEDLLAQFHSMKKDLDFDEFNEKSQHEKEVLGLTNQHKFAKKTQDEKESIMDSKNDAMSDRNEQIVEETEHVDADEEFMKKLSGECEKAAKTFDQRAQTRSDELTALSDALDRLKSGALPNYKAADIHIDPTTGKETSLQKRGLQNRGLSLSLVEKPLSSPVMLVQIESVEHDESGVDGVLRHVGSMITEAAERTRSSTLSALAVRLGLRQTLGVKAVDHFVIVRGLIKNLIKKLEADALSEHNQKGDCDAGIKKATSDRDEANARIEAATASLTVLNAQREAAKVNEQKLNAEIAELKKAVLEATELHEELAANMEEKIGFCQEGAAAVEFALETLNEFYSKTAADVALVQKSRKYTPFGADRHGNVMDDMAPEGAQPDREYHGKQEESKGIIGILEVILSDFRRSQKNAADDEAASKEELEDFEKTAEVDTKKKKAIIQKSQERIAECDGDIADQETELKDAQGLLDSATEALEGWHAMCVKGEETWEERQAKREAEINAIREALAFLDHWQDTESRHQSEYLR